MTTTQITASLNEARTTRLFLVRGVVAIAWAAVFAVVAGSATTEVTIGVGVLLVLYALIDAVASLMDARSQRGSARHLLLANVAVGAATAVALGVAATGTIANVQAVFGVWAGITGAAQLVVALRRRAQFGKQWPMLLAGGLSVVFGVAFIIAAARENAMVMMIVVYAATGGVDFLVQAWLLARRRRRVATVPAHA